MLVQEEGSPVPWPPQSSLLRGEGPGRVPRAAGEAGQGEAVAAGQKAHKWVPQMYILALSASRSWTKIAVFLKKQAVRH